MAYKTCAWCGKVASTTAPGGLDIRSEGSRLRDARAIGGAWADGETHVSREDGFFCSRKCVKEAKEDGLIDDFTVAKAKALAESRTDYASTAATVGGGLIAVIGSIGFGGFFVIILMITMCSS